MFSLGLTWVLGAVLLSLAASSLATSEDNYGMWTSAFPPLWKDEPLENEASLEKTTDPQQWLDSYQSWTDLFDDDYAESSYTGDSSTNYSSTGDSYNNNDDDDDFNFDDSFYTDDSSYSSGSSYHAGYIGGGAGGFFIIIIVPVCVCRRRRRTQQAVVVRRRWWIVTNRRNDCEAPGISAITPSTHPVQPVKPPGYSPAQPGSQPPSYYAVNEPGGFASKTLCDEQQEQPPAYETRDTRPLIDV